jgi:hypothetical protein
LLRAVLVQVLAELDRQLAHEAVVSTHNNVLGVACLHAATNLASALQHHCALTVLDQVRLSCLVSLTWRVELFQHMCGPCVQL